MHVFDPVDGSASFALRRCRSPACISWRRAREAVKAKTPQDGATSSHIPGKIGLFSMSSLSPLVGRREISTVAGEVGRDNRKIVD